MPKWLVKLNCLIGNHEWTCDSEQGIPAKIPNRKLSLKEMEYLFWEYARMYCKHCGCQSKYNRV